MANTNTSMNKTPSAYVNSVNINDSYMIRVEQEHGEIGSRPSNMPKFQGNGKLSIEHVGRSK